jgi:hypothetical protein
MQKLGGCRGLTALMRGLMLSGFGEQLQGAWKCYQEGDWAGVVKELGRLGVDALTMLDQVCFVAGTPMLTPEGSRAIEDFRAGDWILSAPEDDPEARPEPKQVEETFQRSAAVLDLYVGGRLIRTTSAHPFYCRDKGWVEAGALKPGDLLRGHDGRWTAVTKVVETPDRVTVYNLRIADHHTYFVGGADWGFSVWAHNAGGECVGAEGPRENPVADPERPVYLKEHSGKPVEDHIRARSLGGDATDPANLDTKPLEWNSRKGAYERLHATAKRWLIAMGLKPEQGEHVLSHELDWLMNDVLGRPTDPNVLDNLPARSK